MGISNTNHEILKQIQSIFGGNIYKRRLVKLKNNKGYCKQSFVWEIEADKSLIFLNGIKASSIVKNKQITLGIEYRNNIKMCNGRKGLSTEEKEKRKTFIDGMKKINHCSHEEHIGNTFLDSNNLTENLLQYIAGFFDAEGCVYIHKSNFMLRIIIGQTNKDVLNFIQNYFGGKIRKKTNIQQTDGYKRKQSWTWELTSKNTTYFMECIKPYILEKKEQIEVAIKYQIHDLIMHTTTKLSVDEISTREKYRVKLVMLKRDNLNKELKYFEGLTHQ